MMKKLLKIIVIATLPKSVYFPNYQRYRSQILVSQIGDFNEDRVKNFTTHISHILSDKHQRALRSGRFIVLKDSISPKMGT